MKYQYQMFNFKPRDNGTALVFGLDFDKETMEKIDVELRERHHKDDIEQVGFVGEDNKGYRLEMAGGEFCGNAMRCAANYFLGNKIGNIEIRTSMGSGEPPKLLKAGVKEIGKAWTEISCCGNIQKFVSVAADTDFFLVDLGGIVHLVILPNKSEPFLRRARSEKSLEGWTNSFGKDEAKKAAAEESFKNEIKPIAKKLMDEHSLTERDACGVMLLEEISNGLKMHPCVFVKGREEVVYETACGSGSIAVAMADAFLRKDSVKKPVVQPSESIIDAVVEIEANETITNAYIDGPVKTNGEPISRELET